MPSDDQRPTGLVRPDRAALARVHEARERAIAVLSDAFANDVLEVEEFERRVTLAHTSETAEAIAALTADLPASTTALTPATVALAPAAPESHAPPETVYAIFGGVDRRGSWTVPRRWRVRAIFGGGQLDLREARFPTGVIDLEVKAVFGGVQIIVPPGLAVEVSGTAIMGGFDVTMRLAGESEHQAHRRSKLEARRERRALRDARRETRRHQRALDRLRDEP